MERGDIFFASARYRTRAEAWHPIIFWGEHDADHFIGLMVTHGRSERFPDNVPLQDERYFEFCSEDFSDSYVVGQALIKKNEWGSRDGQLIGRLNAEGLALIEGGIIARTEPCSWAEYRGF